MAPRPYIVAVRYDVEPVLVGRSRTEAFDAIRRDFGTIAKLGFTTALLQHVEDTDRRALLELARASGLTAALPDRGFEHYVSTRTLSAACDDVRDLLRAVPPELLEHPAFVSLVVSGGSNVSTAGRAARLRAVLAEGAIPCLSPNGLPIRHDCDDAAVAAVDVGDVPRDADASLVERYLAGFHAGLIAGRTAGLLVDRYHRTAGDPPGLTAQGGSLSPTHAATIKKLVTRARHWGPRLCRFATMPVSNARGDPPGIEVTALTGGRRRYVLVFNTSLDRYTRGEVQLPESIGGTPAIRAVEVPPSAGTAPGRVIDAEHGRITLSVSLRPGDAALFEVF